MRCDPMRLEIDVGRIQGQDFGDFQRLGIDRVGDLLWRGAAVGGVELDAEIPIGAAGVVAGRKDQAAEGFVLANDAGRGGRRQDAARAGENTSEAVRGCDTDHGLNCSRVIIAAVAANHERHPAEPLRAAGRR